MGKIFLCRVEYLEKSKHLQDQLRELRSEIEVLKVGEKQTELDQLHDEQVRLGETKYSTLRKVSAVLCLLSVCSLRWCFGLH
jgi:merlin protein